MAGLNKVQIIGNLGRDPEVKVTASTSICNFSVAVTERGKVGTEWQDVTEWFRVVCFGKTADVVSTYCAKGKQVYVEGRLQTRKYKDKEGNEKSSTELVADKVVLLGSGNGGAARGEGQDRPASPAHGADADEELPF